jgi:purine-binding chemotaxis protein CheW
MNNAALQQKIEQAQENGDLQQYITFAVDQEEYAIDIITVREIKAWSQTTTLPNTQAHMRGVINLRGAIVPIYDMRVMFGKGLTAATKSHVVIILSVESRTIGILVDAVSDIVSLDNTTIQEPPHNRDAASGQNYITGLVQNNNQMVMLLNPKALIAGEKNQQDLEAVEAATI